MSNSGISICQINKPKWTYIQTADKTSLASALINDSYLSFLQLSIDNNSDRYSISIAP